MGTIEDIVFDDLYSHGTNQFLLLDDEPPSTNGPSPTIPLRSALILTFIRVFRKLLPCQQHVNENNRKIFTLVISNQQLINWNNLINLLDPNLDKVYIYSRSYYDYIRMKRWHGCYRDQIQGVYQCDKLDYKLLLLGVDHIHTVKEECADDRGLCKRFSADGRRLLQALAQYFDDDEDEPLGEEAQ
ncbi:hypothetical protein I4U23_017864 [Adineta vaga]|nr:hypothetical protein I4U23_017864 [Adineta vaga]